MAINKVNYGDQTLMDLTEDTVTEDKVLEGETFHDRSGNSRVGSLVIPVQDVEVNGESVVNSEKVAEIDIPTTDIQTAVDEFETYNGGLLSSLKVALSPNQDLHGYDSPWVGGSRKNLLPNNLTTETVYDVTYETQEDGSIEGNGTSTGWANANLVNDLLLKAGTYILSGTTITGAYISVITLLGGEDYSITGSNSTRQITFETDTHVMVRISAKPATVLSNAKYYPMIRLSTESDPTFEPYSNICPISGHTEVDIDVSDGQATQEQVTVNLGGTYYSGTLDIVTGVFTPDTASEVYDGSADENWYIVPSDPNAYFLIDVPTMTATNWKYLWSESFKTIQSPSGRSTENTIWGQYQQIHIHAPSSIAPSGVTSAGLSEFKTWLSENPQTIVYELATPTPIQLSPTMVKALVGENHLSAPLDGQEITESKYRELFTLDEVEEIAQKMADSKIDNLNTSYDTTFSSAFTEARYVKKIYEAPALTALQYVLSGAPSITFNHQLIFSDAQTCCELIQFGSGARIGITDVSISQGSVTFTFDSPLTKAIGFRCRITNDFVS